MPAVFETREVLAGAYRESNPKSFLTHTVDVATEKPICSRVKPDHIADAGSLTPAERAAAPTCPVCARRDPRFL